jgi:hypothetical protein
MSFAWEVKAEKQDGSYAESFLPSKEAACFSGRLLFYLVTALSGSIESVLISLPKVNT